MLSYGQVGVYYPARFRVTEYTPSYYDYSFSPFRDAFKPLIRYALILRWFHSYCLSV